MRRILLLLVVGCGSTAVPMDASSEASLDDRHDASFDAELSFDGGLDAYVDIKGTCPKAMPQWGTSCTSSGTAGLMCEYDTTYFPKCVLECDASGSWHIVNGANECPPWDAGTPVCPQTIPAKGAGCSAQGECNYQAGSCLCMSTCGGPPGDPMPSTWMCSMNQPNCPVPRPRFGDACSTPEQACSYTLCCGGSYMLCHNGIWIGSVADISCP